MPIVIALFLGAAVGSFLNVCILRVPKNESVVTPGSHCLSCREKIEWFDNIPVFSFIFLKGRCRHCLEAISWQYPLVEVASAALFVEFYRFFGFSPKGVFYLILTLSLFVVSFIDFRHRIIPDKITLPGVALGLLASTAFPSLQGDSVWWVGFLKSVLGILSGGGILYLVGSVAERLLKKEAMGGGDVKLLAMIGAFTGLPGVLWTLFTSSVLGSLVGGYLKWKKGEELIPYGPYLAAGCVFYLFFSTSIMAWYLKVMGAA